MLVSFEPARVCLIQGKLNFEKLVTFACVFLSTTNKSQFFRFGHNFVFRVPAVFRRNKLEKFLNYVRLRP